MSVVRAGLTPVITVAELSKNAGFSYLAVSVLRFSV
jgi:hypothetical protein